MNMIHRFMGCIREYKKPTILTLLCMVGEVAIEVLIPFFTANLVNEIKGGAELSGVVRVGLGLILMSLVSLGCGALGGIYAAARRRAFRLARERRLCQKRPPRCFHPRAELRV